MTDQRKNDTYYFRAPQKFLGQRVILGKVYELHYDIKWTGSGDPYDTVPEVKLVGGGGVRGFITLVCETGVPPKGQWVHRRVVMNELFPGWVAHIPAVDEQGKPVISIQRPAEGWVFMEVMRNLVDLQIRGEFGSKEDTAYLDNVILKDVPPDFFPPH